MLVGVISDTHDNVPAVRAAVAVFEDRGADAVVHCGDVVAPPVVGEFSGFECHFVLGNNDGELDGLDRTIRALGEGSVLHGRFADLEFDGKHVAVLHGEDTDQVETLAEGGGFDYVCYGHHHVAEVRSVGETTVVNPGAHFPTVPEEDRSVALIDTVSGDVELVSIDAGLTA